MKLRIHHYGEDSDEGKHTPDYIRSTAFLKHRIKELFARFGVNEVEWPPLG